MMASTRKKTVLITGTSPGGLGHALAHEFKIQGYHVIAAARRPDVLEELANSGMSTVALDVNDQKSIDAAKAEVERITNGSLDILVNNAGITYVMPLTDVSLDKVRGLFETNVFSVMAVTNTFLPLLLASQGLIVNISSASDRLPFPFKGAYAMTKAALSSYSRTLSVELAEHGVRVLNVVPGFVGSLLGKRSTAEPWPADSLFDKMRGTGQKAGSGKRISGEEYARQVVAEVLRGKGWEVGPWRFFGTRESMMLGTMSYPMWILSFLGENWARFAMLKMWPFWMLRENRNGTKKSV